MEPKFPSNSNLKDDDKVRQPVFEVDSRRENSTRYIFKNVVVAVDRSERNIKGIPEILFATYDYDPAQASMEQPDFSRSGVDMDYIISCITAVAGEIGETKLWFDPYKDDAKSGDQASLPNEAQKQKRKEARAKLFSRYGDIEPGPNGQGYIINI